LRMESQSRRGIDALDHRLKGALIGIHRGLASEAPWGWHLPLGMPEGTFAAQSIRERVSRGRIMPSPPKKCRWRTGAASADLEDLWLLEPKPGGLAFASVFTPDSTRSGGVRGIAASPFWQENEQHLVVLPDPKVVRHPGGGGALVDELGRKVVDFDHR